MASSTRGHCSLVMVITCDIQRDIFLLFQKILVKTKNEFHQIKKRPFVIFGHISPNMKWANITLRQISPLFQKFGFINTRTLFSCYGFHLGYPEGHISPVSKNLGSNREKFLHMKIWPYVMLGHISPMLKLANIMLRQISPVF